ncbi:hypothetical protein MKK69_09385 [Methylobacterium sp. J-026]|uniref:hypothetical protein n=1 Tax=Methylobacterium sp. J-026 TaxID=2836624 RepID=UPI001FBA42F0|nr:hypothetical protein [Methylobacterium sp. J-026]MCJ2134265.1 hypothetical protein [Methylobacterium sp. J-026]
MLPRSRRTVRSDCLFAEVCARLPLFEGLAEDTIADLSASGFGRGFLTASLRARLRKAGVQDLGHLARSSPDAITGIRKFGPVRLERVRSVILDALARRLPDARARHAADATRARRLGRLRDMPVGCLPLDPGALAALGLEGGTCAGIADRSRLDLLGGGATPGEVDRIVAALAHVLGAGETVAPRATEAGPDAPEPDAAARRAALRAEQDRDWEAAAPAGARGRDHPDGAQTSASARVRVAGRARAPAAPEADPPRRKGRRIRVTAG